jgi:hypothetical protein
MVFVPEKRGRIGMADGAADRAVEQDAVLGVIGSFGEETGEAVAARARGDAVVVLFLHRVGPREGDGVGARCGDRALDREPSVAIDHVVDEVPAGAEDDERFAGGGDQ